MQPQQEDDEGWAERQPGPAQSQPNAQQSGLGLEGQGEVRSDLTSRKVHRGHRSGKAGLEWRGVAAGRPRAGRERRATDAIWGDGRQGCNQGRLHGGAALPALHLMGLGHYCLQSAWGARTGVVRGTRRPWKAGALVGAAGTGCPGLCPSSALHSKHSRSGFLNSSLTTLW